MGKSLLGQRVELNGAPAIRIRGLYVSLIGFSQLLLRAALSTMPYATELAKTYTQRANCCTLMHSAENGQTTFYTNITKPCEAIDRTIYAGQ